MSLSITPLKTKITPYFRVLSFLLPAAFFSAINTSFTPSAEVAAVSVVTDETRKIFLQMSRGLAILLLVVWALIIITTNKGLSSAPTSSYVCSRVYLHNPPGEDNSLNLATAPLAPEALKDHVARLRDEDPEVNQWVCISVLAICLGLMAATAEFVGLVILLSYTIDMLTTVQRWFTASISCENSLA